MRNLQRAIATGLAATCIAGVFASAVADDAKVVVPVNLVDARTKQVVWEGEVPDVLPLPVSSPTGATKKIDTAVAKLFTKFPPMA